MRSIWLHVMFWRMSLCWSLHHDDRKVLHGKFSQLGGVFGLIDGCQHSVLTHSFFSCRKPHPGKTRLCTIQAAIVDSISPHFIEVLKVSKLTRSRGVLSSKNSVSFVQCFAATIRHTKVHTTLSLFSDQNYQIRHSHVHPIVLHILSCSYDHSLEDSLQSLVSVHIERFSLVE